ncbi:aldo/keto reductase [Parapedobacter indicus]|uniref:Predicted oxidoreductase n=1 Tax=Parapedobacter indicus TaxID=1477437 RepID=A0A1I3KLQ3_9SPHI|nr:aldo/keto reductase [Parapedobacter indicus]PPL01852.1 aryl-alcohol dehydrogenase-like predicted oxidoreductase [Parapedobacter indicus]SFI73085.1 Predicted oxidoreductase [Parapedobacter indicus]
MRYRTLTGTGLDLSVITFGAWAAGGWMWGGTERKDAVEAIRASYDLGVNSIDTAPIYGQGTSEEIVGEAIKGIPRDKVYLLTKYGMRWDLVKGTLASHSKNNSGEDIDIYKYAGKESVIKECEDSLRRLRTDYIDLYQIHWPDVTTPISETMEAVAQLIQQGKIRYAGVCNYNVEQLAEASRYVDIVSNQVPYSMVKRGIEAEVVPYCLGQEKSILAYSPMERGLLTGKMKPGHKFSEGDHRAKLYFFSEENLRRTNAFLETIKPLATEKGISLGQLTLLWTLEQPGITIALVGARNAEQAIQNAKTTDASLAAEEIAFISSELDKLELVK